MADAKEDAEDPCWCNQDCPVSINTLPTVKFSTVNNNKSFRCDNSMNFPNISSVEKYDIGPTWLGYRSKKENKAPIIGVPAA
ncbi:MAG: hypothetical protein A2167_02930 [Planctomycetes bacterium RBG_13_46_10]|nr:MAG: hypothetical protein A2167_02930 [Planctomycetes bacterium RBG_13_46_10]